MSEIPLIPTLPCIFVALLKRPRMDILLRNGVLGFVLSLGSKNVRLDRISGSHCIHPRAVDIVTCRGNVCVTYRRGLDWIIGFIVLIHSVRNYN
jgi:hypothetical protein